MWIIGSPVVCLYFGSSGYLKSCPYVLINISAESDEFPQFGHSKEFGLDWTRSFLLIPLLLVLISDTWIWKPFDHHVLRAERNFHVTSGFGPIRRGLGSSSEWNTTIKRSHPSWWSSRYILSWVSSVIRCNTVHYPLFLDTIGDRSGITPRREEGEVVLYYIRPLLYKISPNFLWECSDVATW